MITDEEKEEIIREELEAKGYKDEEIIESLKITKDMKESKAKRIKNIFLKYKDWIRTTYDTIPFEEPIMFLERGSGKVEFYENATAGFLEFTHSNGDTRFLVITPTRKKEFGFGKKAFKGYYCHEDFPLPLPEDPLATTEQMDIVLKNAMASMDKLRAEELKQKGEAQRKLIKTVAYAIAGIIGMIILYKLVVPEPQQVVQMVTPAVSAVKTEALNNMSNSVKIFS